MNVCIGGTFSPLHKGHKLLIKTACELAGTNGKVFIGLTSVEMVTQKGPIEPYAKRKHALEQFLKEEHVQADVEIQPLHDLYGPAIEREYQAIVVSPETKKVAEDINRKRKEQQKKPLRIVVIPLVLAEDHHPICSTRIRRHEIDENGTVLR